MAASDPMRLALEAAAAVRGTTSPNPWVGCVLVRDGHVIATGATQPYPGAHAEAMALTGADARGAEAFVTLEPCAPFDGKKTPPCSDALARAGVTRVTIALRDPDPRVAGRGIARLQEAGIQVVVGDGAAEATELLRPYLKHRATGLPYVIAKFAVSLDGMLGAPGMRWLTSDRARARAHEDRARVDAILAGSGTILADDPALTARRGGALTAHQPVRVVLDASGRIPATAQIFAGPGRPIVATTTGAPEDWRASLLAAGATLLDCEAAGEGLNLQQLIQALGQRAVLSLIIEGGANTLASFFEQELVDEVHAYVAPVLLGAGGLPLLAGRSLPEALRLRDVTIEPLDPDVLVRGYTGTWSP